MANAPRVPLEVLILDEMLSEIAYYYAFATNTEPDQSEGVNTVYNVSRMILTRVHQCTQGEAPENVRVRRRLQEALDAYGVPMIALAVDQTLSPGTLEELEEEGYNGRGSAA